MKDFKSDGCTLWPDWHYKDCCVQHDFEYWMGGSYRERQRSDWKLAKCVWRSGRWWSPLMAVVMYVGVRIGGAFFWPVPWRWGHGHRWPKCKPDCQS